MKYAVVCYAEHDDDVASTDLFDSFNDAVEFLKQDAQDTYEETIGDSDSDDVSFWIEKDYAELICDDGEYKLTWNIEMVDTH